MFSPQACISPEEAIVRPGVFPGQAALRLPPVPPLSLRVPVGRGRPTKRITSSPALTCVQS
jgi:hypothetical protein